MQITLILTAGGWMADFGDDAEIRSLFGTTVLPTAFGKSARYADVRAKVQQMNPGREVV